VLVAFDRTNAPLEIPILLAAVVLAGLVGFALVILVGDAYLEVIGRLPYWAVSITVLVLLVGLSFLFAGPVGVAIFVAAAAIGMVPVRLGAARSPDGSPVSSDTALVTDLDRPVFCGKSPHPVWTRWDRFALVVRPS